jgi:hypothetical protein
LTALKEIHNRNSLLLCILGGALMIGSGISGTLGYLPDLQEVVDDLLGASFSLTFGIIMGILASLTAIGGLGVILGGLVLTTRHVETGRYLVTIMVVMGALSLIMSLVQLIMAGIIVMGFTVQLIQSFGWLGAIMATIARIISEQQSLVPKS